MLTNSYLSTRAAIAPSSRRKCGLGDIGENDRKVGNQMLNCVFMDLRCALTKYVAMQSATYQLCFVMQV